MEQINIKCERETKVKLIFPELPENDNNKKS